MEVQMSAMLQFKGRKDRDKGVELIGYLVAEVLKGEDVKYKSEIPVEKIPCTLCDNKHPQLYAFWRKPAGVFGCWVVFRYNGDEHIPDLSVPIRLMKAPRGSRKLDGFENSEYWHG
jgi:hypothetical protein